MKTQQEAAATIRATRVAGAVFALLQFTLYRPPEGIGVPFPQVHVGAAIALILLGLNILSRAWTRTADPVRLARRSAAELGADAAIVVGIVWLFGFDPTSALWALLVIPVLEGALRFQLRGALFTWAGLAAGYLLREIWAARAFPHAEFLPESVTYRMGIVFIVALTAGSLARNLTRQVEAVHRINTESQHRALHDPLTGLPNRLLLSDRLAQSVRRSARSGTTTAVVFLDLDRFKVVNDSLGHAAGDQVLLEVAQRLRRIVRPADTVSRFGGDEFVILCEDLPSELEATRIAERILEEVARPTALGAGELALTASAGIAVASGGEGNADALLRDADVAMYEAKRLGRARVELFDVELRARALERLEVETALPRAIEAGELSLAFQPLIDLHSGGVVAVEALVRWDHPQRGRLPPLTFIPIAEETGVIHPLGRWVIAEACREATRWRNLPGRGAPILSVNLSPRQLAHPGLLDAIEEALSETGLDPARLCLEITEGTLMEDAEFCIEGLLGLKMLGVQVWIDDFGTGHSSLGQLAVLPVDALKIDRSFVRALGFRPEAETIVSAVAHLAHAQGLMAIAEGIETEFQFQTLRTLGCEFGQGFHIAPPLEPSRLRGFLTTRNLMSSTNGNGSSAMAPARRARRASLVARTLG